jgi:hypothetical protein
MPLLYFVTIACAGKLEIVLEVIFLAMLRGSCCSAIGLNFFVDVTRI